MYVRINCDVIVHVFTHPSVNKYTYLFYILIKNINNVLVNFITYTRLIILHKYYFCFQSSLRNNVRIDNKIMLTSDIL